MHTCYAHVQLCACVEYTDIASAISENGSVAHPTVQSVRLPSVRGFGSRRFGMPSKSGCAVTQMHCSVERPLPRSSHLVAHIPDPITQASLVTLVAGSVLRKNVFRNNSSKPEVGEGQHHVVLGSIVPFE